jgi:RsbRD-like negative regulator of sigma factor
LLLPWLMRLIETHAEQLTENLLQSVRTDARTTFLHELSEAELKRRVFDLYHHLGRWLGESNEAEIEATYAELGRQRLREGVPLSELVHALTLVKRRLWDYVQANDLPDTATNLYGKEQLVVRVGQFFDTALYHTVRGYEEEWSKGSLRLLAGVPGEPGKTRITMNIARAVLGELEARRGALDNEAGLRSVTFAVKLEPPGRVRSITVQQESETDRPRR